MRISIAFCILALAGLAAAFPSEDEIVPQENLLELPNADDSMTDLVEEALRVTGGKGRASKAPKAKFKGCYKDGGHRDLRHGLMGRNRRIASGISYDRCLSHCSKKGFRFFGRQWTNECWCGNKVGRYGKTKGCKCGPKEKNQGGWKNCVYDLGKHAKKKHAKKKPAKKKPAKKKPAKKKPAKKRPAKKKAVLANGMTVAFKGGRAKRWCADEGNRINCNRPWVRGWEKFGVVVTGGKVAFKGGRAKRFCADEGNRIKCNRAWIRGWEKFTVANLGRGQVALKGGRAGKWCSDDSQGVRCNRSWIKGWEKFGVMVVSKGAKGGKGRL